MMLKIDNESTNSEEIALEKNESILRQKKLRAD
jgi:hypothetical protein